MVARKEIETLKYEIYSKIHDAEVLSDVCRLVYAYENVIKQIVSVTRNHIEHPDLENINTWKEYLKEFLMDL